MNRVVKAIDPVAAASGVAQRRRFLDRAVGALTTAGLPAWVGAQASSGPAQTPAGTATAAPSGAVAIEEARAPGLPKVGSPLALPAVDWLDGGRFRPEDAQGRVLIVYWWASWCPFCAQQNPSIEALWRRERARGLGFLGLSIDRRAQDAIDYRQRKGYTFPSGLVSAAVQSVLPKPQGLPILLVRGRDGRVLQAERGQLFPEDIEALSRWLG